MKEFIIPITHILFPTFMINLSNNLSKRCSLEYGDVFVGPFLSFFPMTVLRRINSCKNVGPMLNRREGKIS